MSKSAQESATTIRFSRELRLRLDRIRLERAERGFSRQSMRDLVIEALDLLFAKEVKAV